MDGSPRWYDRRKGNVAKCRGAFNGEITRHGPIVQPEPGKSRKKYATYELIKSCKFVNEQSLTHPVS